LNDSDTCVLPAEHDHQHEERAVPRGRWLLLPAARIGRGDHEVLVDRCGWGREARRSGRFGRCEREWAWSPAAADRAIATSGGSKPPPRRLADQRRPTQLRRPPTHRRRRLHRRRSRPPNTARRPPRSRSPSRRRHHDARQHL